MEEIHEIHASESRGKPMYMRDWSGKLDAFLKFNEQDILQNSGIA
ncbi:virulence RhuM family protein [Candidatus Methanoperedens nitratireducens]|nr:virulence RhuM family protein [Candidatus Methanoperedens nitroreducens]